MKLFCTVTCLLAGVFPTLVSGSGLQALPLNFEHKDRSVANVSPLGYYQMTIPLRPIAVGDYQIPVNLEFSTNAKERSKLGLFWSLPLLESRVYRLNRNTIVFVGINGERISFNLSNNNSKKIASQVGSWHYESLGNSKEVVTNKSSPTIKFSFVDGALRRLDVLPTSVSGSESLLFKSLANYSSIVDRRSAHELLILNHPGHGEDGLLTVSNGHESYNYDIAKQEMRIQGFFESVVERFHGGDVGFDCHYFQNVGLNKYSERVDSLGARFGLEFRKVGEVLNLDIESSNEAFDVNILWEVESGWPIGLNGGLLYVTSSQAATNSKFKCLRGGIANNDSWEFFDYDGSSGNNEYYNSNQYFSRELKILTPGYTYMKPRKLLSRLADGSLSEEKLSYNKYGNEK